MKFNHWVPFIAIMVLFVTYNVFETNYFTRTLGDNGVYPRSDAELIADGICFLIAAIAFATLGIIQTLVSVISWFGNVKVTVQHVKEEDVSKAAKDYQSTV